MNQFFDLLDTPEALWFSMVAAIIVMAIMLVKKNKPKYIELVEDIDFPVSTIVKEYQLLYERITNAATKTELSVLEQQSLEFKQDFSRHCYVEDLWKNLSQELNIRYHILSCQLQEV